MKYELMHRTISTAVLEIDDHYGYVSKIENISEPDHMPIGVIDEKERSNCESLNEWWKDRSIPIYRPRVIKMLVSFDVLAPYPERGVCTEKLASGITHIIPGEEIIGFLNRYTEELKKVSPEDCTWCIRYSRHGVPHPMKFGPITEENHNEAYKFALAPYGRLKEDLVKVCEACKIPKITLSIAQNTYIYKRLLSSNDPESVEILADDLLLKDPAPLKQCKKLISS